MEKKMFLKASSEIFKRAKELRDNPTHSERLLWVYLQKKPLGYKFRRQHPISVYILDFYCHDLKLAIEADGNVHQEVGVALNDVERQKHLEDHGMTFLRFTNHEIEKQMETVVERIEKYIVNHPKYILKSVK